RRLNRFLVAAHDDGRGGDTCPDGGGRWNFSFCALPYTYAMAEETGCKHEGWKSSHRYIGGALIGGLVFIGVPETARWLNGGAFAQSPTIPNPPPQINGNCNFPGGTNNGSIVCNNTATTMVS